MNQFGCLLQLFAETDSAAAHTGENSAAAGHTQLLALGVPPEKLRKDRAYRVSASGAAPAQDAAAPTEGKPRMDWSEICADPEYNGKLQQLIRARLKEEKQASADLQTLSPALQKMARSYGLDEQTLDYGALSRAITADPRLQTGQAPADGGALRAHYNRLVAQGEELRKRMPEFDVGKALADPAFIRLTAPGVGLSVEDAYYALHRKELQQQAALQITNGIRSGSIRPGENGMAAQGAAVTTFNYRNASREQREALKQAIRTAGARGEKIYPGDWNV